MEAKKVRRMRNKVLKMHPNAKAINSGDGYILMEGDNVIGAEHLIPPQPTEDEAWFWGGESLRIARNIKRTHPLKAEIFGGSDEEKQDRMFRRTLRGQDNKYN